MPRVPEILTFDQTPLFDAPAQTHSAAVVKPVRLETSSRAVRIFRATWRLIYFCSTLVWVALDFMLRVKRNDIRDRCEWMSRSARALMKCVNLHVEYLGEPPRDGLLVSNHLSYLDILVFGARQPAVFVSKADVRGWPVLGFLAKLGAHCSCGVTCVRMFHR